MNQHRSMAALGRSASEPRPHVTFIVSQLSPLLGIEAATTSLAQALHRYYEIDVIVLADAVSETQLNSAIAVESWGGKVTGWQRVVTVLRALRHRSEISEDGIVILSGAWAAIPTLIALPKRIRARTLVWEHSFDKDKVRSHRSLAILRLLGRLLYPRARVTVTVSTSLRNDMISAGFKGPLEVIPNIIRQFDVNRSAERIPGRLLTVGSLSVTKNQSLALRTLALLPSCYSLDVVGDGPERCALGRLAVELGIDDRVAFVGYRADPSEYFLRSQLLIHPSLGETYGMVLFEAACFQRPVVAVNQSVMQEFIPKFVPGMTAEPRPDTFASAILSLAAQPVPERDFAEAARRREVMLQDIIHDWRQLIESML